MSRDYSRPPLDSQTSGLEIGTLLVSALPDVWRYSVSAKASSPGVSNVCLSTSNCRSKSVPEMYFECRWEVKTIKEYLLTVLLLLLFCCCCCCCCLFVCLFCFVLFLVYFWRRQDTIQVTRGVVSDQGLTHARWIQPGYMVPETVVVHGLWCPKTVLKGNCTYPTLDGE